MKLLYEYAIIHQPPQTTDAMGNDTTKPATVLIEPTYVLARDEKEASIIAARAIPEAYLGKLDEVQLALRPF